MGRGDGGTLRQHYSALGFEAKGPGFTNHPREIHPTLHFVLGPPGVIPLPVDQGPSSGVECSLLNHPGCMDQPRDSAYP